MNKYPLKDGCEDDVTDVSTNVTTNIKIIRLFKLRL